MNFLFLAAVAASAQPVTLATYAYPAYDRREALTPLAALLERSVRRPVTISIFDSPEALAQAVRGGTVDIAVTNLAAFITASGNPAVKPLAVLAPPLTTLDRYRGVLLARRALGADTLGGLRDRTAGLRYIEVLPGSTSGALVQRDALGLAGLDRSTFGTVTQSGTHDAAITLLAAGKGDLAALAETPWRTFQSAQPAQAAGLIQLWRSAPLPPGPVVCVQSVRFDCRLVAGLLTRPGEATRAAAIALSKGWSETEGAVAFRPVDRRAYASFLQSRSEARR